MQKIFNKEMNKEETSSFACEDYKLPDGNIVKLKSERFKCAEALFQPSLMDLQMPGVHTMLYNSFMECDNDVRRDFYANIIVNGGSTMLPGFPERLNIEMKKLLPKTMKTKVVAPPERKYSVWIGGSIMSSLSTFQEVWIVREEYDEYGPAIIHRRKGYFFWIHCMNKQLFFIA